MMVDNEGFRRWASSLATDTPTAEDPTPEDELARRSDRLADAYSSVDFDSAEKSSKGVRS